MFVLLKQYLAPNENMEFSPYVGKNVSSSICLEIKTNFRTLEDGERIEKDSWGPSFKSIMDDTY